MLEAEIDWLYAKEKRKMKNRIRKNFFTMMLNINVFESISSL